jgi:hypothetical protein
MMSKSHKQLDARAAGISREALPKVERLRGVGFQVGWYERNPETEMARCIC